MILDGKDTLIYVALNLEIRYTLSTGRAKNFKWEDSKPTRKGKPIGHVGPA